MSTGVCVCVGLGMAGPGTIIVGGEEVEPLIFLDFKEGVYTADGEAVAVGDLLVEDTDFGAWDPANIVEDVGLVGAGDAAPVFSGDALALVVAGSTIVAYFTGTNNAFRFELVDSADYNSYYSAKAQFGASGISGLEDNSTQTALARLPNGYHKMVVTFVEGKLSLSFNGNPVTTIDPGDPWTPAMGVMNMIVPAGVTLETLGLYPPQDDEDLPSLSANGAPVNTVAPAVSGTAQVGEILTCSTGTWTDAVSYAYQWFAAGSFAIGGATANTFELTGDQVDQTISCVVTATNASGSMPLQTAETDPVVAAP